jgi:hypothetical protein
MLAKVYTPVGGLVKTRKLGLRPTEREAKKKNVVGVLAY